MNLKTINEGYKIYSLYYSNNYIIDFKFNNIIEKVIKLKRYFKFSQNETIILDLTDSFLLRFLRSRPFYVLYLDNFFTTYKLYQRLYELGIKVNNMTKTESDILKKLTYLRNVITK